MTRWKGLEINEIETLVKGEHDEVLEKQAEGWAALRELYDTQLTKMQDAHTSLSEAWTSPGGELYLGQFKKVINALKKGKTVADSRATGIMDVAGKIGATQRAVELIRKELDAEEKRQFTQFEADMDEFEDNNSGAEGFFRTVGDYAMSGPGYESRALRGSASTEPKRTEIAAQGSPSFNDRVNTAMTSLAEEMTRVRTDSEMWEKPVYTGPKDGPAPPPNMGMTMPGMPGGVDPGTPPGMPGRPAMPGMPNIPAPQNVPTPPAAPNTPTAPTAPTPNAPNIPAAPGAPGMPSAPGVPGVPPAARTPGMPSGMPTSKPQVAGPMGNSRPVAPGTGAPGAPGAPTAPGKPGVPGKMAPPMGGMGPKGNQKGVKPGGPGRPGTPMGSSGIPGKPGMSGKMAPPAGGMPPKSAKQNPERKPGQPMHPANSGQPGKPGATKGGKGGTPLAGKPSVAKGGGKPGSGQFQAPPHIGRPTGNKPKQQQSGYGKFGSPEGASLGGAPRVTKPGGSRPVLNNRAATPAHSPGGAQNLGLPASQRPPAKAPRKEADSRGVIKPAKPEPKPTAPQRPADYYEKKATRLRENPKTAEYMDNLFTMVGLRSPVIQPAAPPKAHAAGPVIGT